MKLIKRITNRIDYLKDKILDRFEQTTTRITFQRLNGASLYSIVYFFAQGIRKSSISLRAAAISFAFTLALFPGSMFLLALLPYIPIPGLQESIIQTLADLMPENAFEVVQSAIVDTLVHQRVDVLSVGFLFSVYFASEGLMMIMGAFNQSTHAIETRSGFKRRLTALLLVVVLSFTIIISTATLIFSTFLLQFLIEHNLITAQVNVALVYVGQWIILFIMALVSFSLIYFLAPAKRGGLSFFSVGSFSATILALIAARIFTFFIENFGRYNEIYGSLGTVLIILVWININSLVLLLGFEINGSIFDAKKKAEKLQAG